MLRNGMYLSGRGFTQLTTDLTLDPELEGRKQARKMNRTLKLSHICLCSLGLVSVPHHTGDCSPTQKQVF